MSGKRKIGKVECKDENGNIVWRVQPMPYVDGKPAPRLRDRAMHLRGTSEDLADQSEAEGEAGAALMFLRDALEMADRLRGDERQKEARGLKNVNANRRDAAEDRRDEIRQVYKPGMSAGEVLEAMRRAHLGPYPRSTIEKDLRKLRGPRN